MGGTMSRVFGSADSGATNDVLNGQVVPTGTPGASTVADPNQGFSGSQMLTRGLASGLGQGLKNQSQQQQQPRGGAAQIPVTPTPDVSGYYPVQPLTPKTQNDPYSAFYRR